MVKPAWDGLLGVRGVALVPEKFEIKYAQSALDSLRNFPEHDQRIITGKITVYLPKDRDDLLTETRKRKRLRQPNALLSEWELRIGKYRIFYNVDLQDNMVLIEQIGKKEHNTLFVGGKEFEL